MLLRIHVWSIHVWCTWCLPDLSKINRFCIHFFFDQNAVFQRVRKSILYCKLQVTVTLLEATKQNARAVSLPPGSMWTLKKGWMERKKKSEQYTGMSHISRCLAVPLRQRTLDFHRRNDDWDAARGANTVPRCPKICAKCQKKKKHGF